MSHGNYTVYVRARTQGVASANFNEFVVVNDSTIAVLSGAVTSSAYTWLPVGDFNYTSSSIRISDWSDAGLVVDQVRIVQDNPQDPTAQNGSVAIKWLVTDHLGSTRMVIDESGSLAGTRRHDFCPFGEELGAGVGIRSAALGYGADSTRQKFTSKERDSETGLDYFINRYYSSVQGRFTSVDPGNAGAEMEYPQAWNGYSYAINNPLTYSDPDGLKVKVCDANGNCSEISDADANKYLFNKKYQEQSGYRLDGKGGVFDTEGNQIGTYKRTSFDDLSAQANAFIFGTGGMRDQSIRAKPIVEFVGTVAATQIATPVIGLMGAAIVGADLYDNGGKPGLNTAITLASALVPPLRSLHSPKVYESGVAKSSLEYWRKQPTEKIIESLKPGRPESLKVKPDGTVMNGNTRIQALRERGVDVNSLPRESY